MKTLIVGYDIDFDAVIYYTNMRIHPVLITVNNSVGLGNWRYVPLWPSSLVVPKAEGNTFGEALSLAWDWIGNDSVMIAWMGVVVDNNVRNVVKLVEVNQADIVALSAVTPNAPTPPADIKFGTALVALSSSIKSKIKPDVNYKTPIALIDIYMQALKYADTKSVVVPSNIAATMLCVYKAPMTVDYAIDVLRDTQIFESKWGMPHDYLVDVYPSPFELVGTYASRNTGDAYNETLIYGVLHILNARSVCVEARPMLVPALLYAKETGATVYSTLVDDHVERAGLSQLLNSNVPNKCDVVIAWANDLNAVDHNAYINKADKAVIILTESGEPGTDRLMVYNKIKRRKDVKYFPVLWRKGFAVLLKVKPT